MPMLFVMWRDSCKIFSLSTSCLLHLHCPELTQWGCFEMNALCVYKRLALKCQFLCCDCSKSSILTWMPCINVILLYKSKLLHSQVHIDVYCLHGKPLHYKVVFTTLFWTQIVYPTITKELYVHCIRAFQKPASTRQNIFTTCASTTSVGTKLLFWQNVHTTFVHKKVPYRNLYTTYPCTSCMQHTNLTPGSYVDL